MQLNSIKQKEITSISTKVTEILQLKFSVFFNYQEAFYGYAQKHIIVSIHTC